MWREIMLCKVAGGIYFNTYDENEVHIPRERKMKF